MQGILPFVVRRLVWAPFVLLAVLLATFALGRFGPGDPVEILQGQYTRRWWSASATSGA